MKLLAIETSTDLCSVAVALDDQILCEERLAPRQHAELLLPMIDAALARAGIGRAQLDAVAFSQGPGSFTGVRIAASVTQGIAYGLDLPVIPVSTLAALAQGVGGRLIAAALDARLGEVYYGLYGRGDAGLVTPLTPDALLRPEQVSLPETDDWIAVGPGFKAHEEALLLRIAKRGIETFVERLPSARQVAELGRHALANGATVTAQQAMPVYLRERVTQSAPAT